MKYDLKQLIKDNKYVWLVQEGLGSYKGKSRTKSYNPQGRMGAKVSCFLDGLLVYETQNASTLPDSLSDWYARTFNDGMAIPTVYEGVYDVFTTRHLSKYNALELGRWNERIPVIRGGKPSTSSGINFHYRKLNDPSFYSMYTSSIGCITVLSEDLEDMFKAMGIDNFNSLPVGVMIIDRSMISSELAEHYREIYGDMFSQFSSYQDYPKDLSEWFRSGYDFIKKHNISDGTNPKGVVTREMLWENDKRMYELLKQMIEKENE